MKKQAMRSSSSTSALQRPLHHGFSSATSLNETLTSVARLYNRRPPLDMPYLAPEAVHILRLRRAAADTAKAAKEAAKAAEDDEKISMELDAVNMPQQPSPAAAASSARSSSQGPSPPTVVVHGDDDGSALASAPSPTLSSKPPSPPPPVSTSYGYAARVKLPGSSKVSDVLLTPSDTSPTSKDLVKVHGKAFFYLQTGIHPDTLLPNRAPSPAQLRRAKAKKIAAAQAAKAKAEQDARLVDSIWARVAREGPPMERKPPMPNKPSLMLSPRQAARAAAAAAAAEEQRQEQERMLALLNKGTNNLHATIADVKLMAYEHQRQLGLTTKYRAAPTRAQLQQPPPRHEQPHRTLRQIGGQIARSVQWTDRAARPTTAQARTPARAPPTRPGSAPPPPANPPA